MIDLTAGGFIERFNFLEGDFIKKKSLMEYILNPLCSLYDTV